MAALVDSLEALAISSTPVTLPPPPGVRSTSSTSNSSVGQPFEHSSDLRYLIYKPDLVERLREVFRSEIEGAVEAAVQSGTMPALSTRTTREVQAAIQRFQRSDFDYVEVDVEQAITALLQVFLPEIVPELDHILQIEGTKGVRVKQQVPIPTKDQHGRDVCAMFRPDLTFYRKRGTDATTAPDSVAVLTEEFKSPSASKDWDRPHHQAGLFVRAIKIVADKDVLEYNELGSDTAVQSLFKKEIVSAITLDNDLVMFADLFSYIVCLIVPTGKGGSYDVLVSRLERFAPDSSPSRYLLMHLIAFYTRHFDIAGAFAEEAQLRAATYVPVPLNATQAALRSNGQAQTGGRLPTMPEDDAAAGGGEIDTPTAPSAGSKAELSGATLQRERLADLLADEIEIVYPDGNSFVASRSAPTSFHAPSSSTSSHPDDSPPLSSSLDTALSSDVDFPITPRHSPRRVLRALCTRSADLRLKVVELDEVVDMGSTSRVFGGAIDGQRYVMKIPNSRGRDDVEWEIRFLGSAALNSLEGDIVPLEALYRESDGWPAVFMPFAGKAIEDWSVLTQEQGMSLVFSLLRVHQRANIYHGDVAPRNVVLLPGPASMPRLIDFTLADVHAAECRGGECVEIGILVSELGLGAPEVDELKRRAEAEGLWW